MKDFETVEAPKSRATSFAIHQVTVPGRIVDVSGDNKLTVEVPVVEGMHIIDAKTLRAAMTSLSESEFDELLSRLEYIARREMMRSLIRVS